MNIWSQSWIVHVHTDSKRKIQEDIIKSFLTITICCACACNKSFSSKLQWTVQICIPKPSTVVIVNIMLLILLQMQTFTIRASSIRWAITMICFPWLVQAWRHWRNGILLRITLHFRTLIPICPSQLLFSAAVSTCSPIFSNFKFRVISVPCLMYVYIYLHLR